MGCFLKSEPRLDPYDDDDFDHKFDLLMESDMRERKHSLICCFFDNGMSWKVATACAKMWATMYNEGFEEDEDVKFLTNKYNLDDLDAYAVLGMETSFEKEFNKLYDYNDR